MIGPPGDHAGDVRARVGLFALIALTVLSGCATVVRGTKHNVRIESNPVGAHVRLSTGAEGVTPAVFELARKDPVVVEVRMDGYDTVTVTLLPTLSKRGIIAGSGNALIGGAIGGAIDGGSGATLDLQPNPLMLSLRPVLTAPATANWHGLKIGLARREVRELLGEPKVISDESGDQTWTYPGEGTVSFRHFFVTAWHDPQAPQ
ncbi:MAG: hypothetical protein ABIZ04_24835 [Opitutus sp.]